MSEAFVVERDFLFKDSIFEITSISVEHDEDINGSNLEGDFIISGDYRLHEISINKEDFSFKLPFTHEIRSNVNLDTVNLEITDFTYELNNNDELHVHIEYIVSGEQSLIEFADEKDLDEFLNKTDAEVVDLTEDEPRFKEVSKEEILNIPAEDSKKEEKEESKEEIKEDKTSEISTNNIIGSINADETYVKYLVHTVMQNDTLEGILDKYKITLTDLKKYNTFEALEVNMKLVIPENEEN